MRRPFQAIHLNRIRPRHLMLRPSHPHRQPGFRLSRVRLPIQAIYPSRLRPRYLVHRPAHCHCHHHLRLRRFLVCLPIPALHPIRSRPRYPMLRLSRRHRQPQRSLPIPERHRSRQRRRCSTWASWRCRSHCTKAPPRPADRTEDPSQPLARKTEPCAFRPTTASIRPSCDSAFPNGQMSFVLILCWRADASGAAPFTAASWTQQLDGQATRH